MNTTKLKVSMNMYKYSHKNNTMLVIFPFIEVKTDMSNFLSSYVHESYLISEKLFFFEEKTPGLSRVLQTEERATGTINPFF